MRKLIWLLLFIASVSQVQAQSDLWKEWQKRAQKKPNLLPMYGGMPKSKSMMAADQKFLSTVDAHGGSRSDNSREFSKLGWQSIQNRDAITAMNRFNQAWLLDSTNAEAYRGFGYILGMFEAYSESFSHFNRAVHYDSSNVGMLNDYVFMMLVKQKALPTKSDIINAEKLNLHALSLNPSHGYTHQLMSKILYYKNDYEEAWESLYRSKKNGNERFDQDFIKDLHAKLSDPRKEFVKD